MQRKENQMSITHKMIRESAKTTRNMIETYGYAFIAANKAITQIAGITDNPQVIQYIKNYKENLDDLKELMGNDEKTFN